MVCRLEGIVGIISLVGAVVSPVALPGVVGLVALEGPLVLSFPVYPF